MDIERLGHLLLVQASLERALLALAEARVEAMVWKGAALVGTVYALDERFMSDADVIVRDRAAAHDALRRAGFAPVPGPAALVRARRSWGWQPQGGGAHLDLHLSVGLPPMTRVSLPPLFARGVELPVGQARTLRPCDEDLLLLVALDQLTDDFRRKAYPDIARIIDQLPLDWPTVVERAQRWRCANALWLALRHAQVTDRVPQRALAALAPSRARRAVLTRGLRLDARPRDWPRRLRARQAVHHLVAADDPARAALTGVRWLAWRAAYAARGSARDPA